MKIRSNSFSYKQIRGIISFIVVEPIVQTEFDYSV